MRGAGGLEDWTLMSSVTTSVQRALPNINVNVAVVLWQGSAYCYTTNISEHHCILCNVHMMAIFSGPGRFNITSVFIGAANDHIIVTHTQVSRVTALYVRHCDVMHSCIISQLSSALTVT